MLPRAELHEENVMSNEQLNRQRVEAGQIAPIFSVSTWSTLLLSLRIHYASLHICRFLCEVACLSVKWTMCTHSKHVIMRTRTVLSRTWLKVPSSTEGEISTHSSAGPSSDTTRSDSTQPSSSLCASSSLPAQVCAVYELLWPFSLCLVFFTVSHLPLRLSASLSGYHVFFYIYYTALEYVCFIAHLSLYIT